MKPKRLNIFIVAFIAVCGYFISCSKMDDTYKDFIKDGPIAYAGKPDSLHLHPGKYRMKITWLAIADPLVNRAVIYWNNRKDSINVDINRTKMPDTVSVDIDNLTEGTYVFEIYTFDSNGDKSVKTEVIGDIYGDKYQKTILIRPIDVASMLEDDTARIDWGAASYKEAISSELTYTDLSGTEHDIVISSDVLNTVLTNVNAGTLVTYRTKYLPSPLALDTFYTDYQTVRIKGSPIETSKVGWTITASSEDTNGKRYASNLIDGNVVSLYVNKIAAGNTYPHWTIVDMGQTVNDIEGFYFYQRGTNPLKTVEIKISNNYTGKESDWESLGEFTLDKTPTVNTSSPQTAKPVYVNLPRVRSFRYFKQIYKNDYGNSLNVNIHETGVFTR